MMDRCGFCRCDGSLSSCGMRACAGDLWPVKFSVLVVGNGAVYSPGRCEETVHYLSSPSGPERRIKRDIELSSKA